VKLPQGMAASIGRIIARHSYMQWRQAKSLYTLLGISIKQGRAAEIRIANHPVHPHGARPSIVPPQVQGFNFSALKDAIEKRTWRGISLRIPSSCWTTDSVRIPGVAEKLWNAAKRK